MTEETLTRDNLLLSRPNKPNRFAINCTQSLPPEVAQYVQACLSANTLRAYEADIRHFLGWGGQIPSTELEVASYLAAHAAFQKLSTLRRRLAAIAKAHSAHGHVDVTRGPLIKATLQGIKRTRGAAQVGAMPIDGDQLRFVLSRMGDRLQDIRDRALLLLGLAGGFRRSELVGLNVEDLEQSARGARITLRKSKTDQAQVGRTLGIAITGGSDCPVGALNAWLSAADIRSGPLFRPVDRYGNVKGTRLSGEAVSLIVKRRVPGSASAGTVSAHSLRAGYVTAAANHGTPLWKIRRQTGHKSDDGVQRYIRNTDYHLP